MSFRPLGAHVVLKIVLVLVFFGLFGLWLSNLTIPLVGAHQWRQSDTLITGYFYCTEDARFGHPKVAARDGTEGTAIGEFPVFSYLTGLGCMASGGWSEAAPKILNLFFLLGAFFFWGGFVRRRWGTAEHDWIFWAAAFLCTPLHLNYLTIPMPEATALFFFGLAAWLWQTPDLRNKRGLDLLASLIFVFAFMIRPYHIWLLFVIAPSPARMGQVLALCVAGFFGWYRWWAREVTTVPGYFGIGFESPSAVLAAIPKMLRAIPDRLFDQTAWLGLIPLVIGARRAPLWGLGFLASWGTMMVLKPTHLPAHAYYLMNAGIFASVLIWLGFRAMKPRNAAIFASLFVVVSVANVQHNFQRPRDWAGIEKVIEAARQTPADAQVVSFMGPSPRWHYYLKRRGTRRDPSDFRGPGSCPQGMAYFLVEGQNGELQFGPCEKAL